MGTRYVTPSRFVSEVSVVFVTIVSCPIHLKRELIRTRFFVIEAALYFA